MKGYRKYFTKKIVWFLIMLVAAVISLAIFLIKQKTGKAGTAK